MILDFGLGVRMAYIKLGYHRESSGLFPPYHQSEQSLKELVAVCSESLYSAKGSNFLMENNPKLYSFSS